jgi:competence protein ComEC
MPDGLRNAGHTYRNKEVGMPLPALAFSLNVGILPLLFLPVLPEIEHVWMIIVAGCLLASRHQRYIRYTGFTMLFFAWGLLAALQAIWPTQHLPGRIGR